MQLDTLELVSGQVLARLVGGEWVYTPGAAAEGPGPTEEAGDTAAAPSLSLSNNCIKGGKAPRSPSYSAKAKQVLRLNVQEVGRQYGLDRVGLLTLTPPDHLDWRKEEDWREIKRRFHSLRSNVLSKLFWGGVGAWEPMKSGRCHIHLVLGCRRPVRVGFDFVSWFGSLKEYEERGESPLFKQLRSRWMGSATSEHLEVLGALKAACYGEFLGYDEKGMKVWEHPYGFGRYQFEPVEKVEALGAYAGKYLGKLEGEEWAQDFKARRVTRWGSFGPVACMKWAWCRDLSPEEWKARGDDGRSIVGRSAAYIEPTGPEWAVLWGDVENRSGFRSLIRRLQRQGMTAGHTAEVLKAKLGQHWEFHLMQAVKVQTEAAARDCDSRPELLDHLHKIASAQVVKLFRLDTVIDSHGEWLEAWVLRERPEVSRVIEAFGGDVWAEDERHTTNNLRKAAAMVRAHELGRWEGQS